MREIKFEFIYYDGKYFTKCVMTLDELLNKTEDDIYEKATEQYALYSNLENFELVAKRQYTGIKDINNKEVYEGDIVESLKGKQLKVIFYDGAFRLARTQDRIKIIGNIFPSNKTFKVVGNIYENPELLEAS